MKTAYFACALALAGCAAPGGPPTPETAKIPVYEATPGPLAQMRVIKRLWTESGWSLIETPTYRSSEQAAQSLRREAASLGGDAVVNFGCYHASERDGAPLKCNGTIVKLR
jgi:hypothetical protein